MIKSSHQKNNHWILKEQMNKTSSYTYLRENKNTWVVPLRFIASVVYLHRQKVSKHWNISAQCECCMLCKHLMDVCSHCTGGSAIFWTGIPRHSSSICPQTEKGGSKVSKACMTAANTVWGAKNKLTKTRKTDGKRWRGRVRGKQWISL